MNYEEEINSLKQKIASLERGIRIHPGACQIASESIQRVIEGIGYNGGILILLTAPLVSTSWDGDSFSTAAKTLIDLSAVFGVPAGVKAVYVYAAIRDSGSAAGDAYLALAPNDTSGSGMHIDCSGQANDSFERNNFIVPCDANGDIYYQIVATGASTMDIYLQIWGYVI